MRSQARRLVANASECRPGFGPGVLCDTLTRSHTLQYAGAGNMACRRRLVSGDPLVDRNAALGQTQTFPTIAASWVRWQRNRSLRFYAAQCCRLYPNESGVRILCGALRTHAKATAQSTLVLPASRLMLYFPIKATYKGWLKHNSGRSWLEARVCWHTRASMSHALDRSGHEFFRGWWLNAQTSKFSSRPTTQGNQHSPSLS